MQTSRFPTVRPLVVPTLLLVCLACGNSEQAQQTATVIPRAEGGSVSLAGLKLEVPPAALGQDTEISIETRQLADFSPMEGVERVITISPEDTELASPAVLAAELDLASGESATFFRWHDGVDGGWAAIPTTATNGGIQAQIDALGTFSLVKTTVPAESSIVGSVTWGDRSPASGVPVALRLSGTQIAEATTDQAGTFSFSDLAPDNRYTLSIHFECDLEQKVEVSADQVTEVDLVLCGS